MKVLNIIIFTLILLVHNNGISQTCSGLTGIINTYAPVSNINGNTVTIGATSGASAPFAVGDYVVLIQMTGPPPVQSGSNFGNYELRLVSVVSGSSITLDGITRAYSFSTEKVQLIRAPHCSNGTVSATVTAKVWDGSTGGVIALHGGTLTLNANIDASSAGFSQINHQGGIYVDTTPNQGSTDGRGEIGSSDTGGGGDGGGGLGGNGAAGASGGATFGGGGGGGSNGGGGGGAGGVGQGGNGGGNGLGGSAGGANGTGGLGVGGGIGDIDGGGGGGGGGVIGGGGGGGGAILVGGGGGGGYSSVGNGSNASCDDSCGGAGGGSYGGGGGAASAWSGGDDSYQGGGGGSWSGGGIAGVSAAPYPSGQGRGNLPVSIVIPNNAHFLNSTQPHLMMGGAGGNSTCQIGGKGGGIVILQLNSLSGNNNSIISNGETLPLAPNCPAAINSTVNGGGAGGGGGGAGGQMVLNILNFTSNTNIYVKGGKGGSGNNDGNFHGGTGGGGGGGGGIWVHGILSSNTGGQTVNVSNTNLMGVSATTSAVSGGEHGDRTTNPKNGYLTGTGGAGGDGLIISSPTTPAWPVSPCTISSITATPSPCAPATNTYSVSGSITFTYAPATGTLTVIIGSTTQTFSAPFTSPQAYTLTGLTADGASHTVTAVFSADAACTASQTYTAPVNCTVAGDCACHDMIYLNDTGANPNVVHKFQVDATTGALTEIGSPWLVATGVVNAPHGVAADINGNIYISQASSPNFIGKFSCDGQKIDADISTPATIDNLVDNIFGFDFFSIDNYLYVNATNSTTGNTYEMHLYDLCTGDLIGCQASAAGWSSAIGPDGYWYLSSGNKIYRGPTDPSTFTTPCNTTVIEDNWMNATQLGLSGVDRIMGIDFDAAGNLYGVVSANEFDPPSRVIKINPTTKTVIDQSAVDSSVDNDPNDNLNWGGARGLIYSKEADMIYVSSLDDCVAAFDTDLNYVPVASNHVKGDFPKQIGIITECCPVTTPLTYNEVVCSNGNGEKVFLQDVLTCGDGVICEGMWTETSNTSGGNIVFNECDLSITVNGSGCATYKLEKTTAATGNQQCGAFSITLTVCTEVPSATMTPTMGTCTGTTPNNNATIVLSSVVNADQAGYSTGSIYTGPAYGASGTINITGGGTITGLMHNTTYTVRVFNGSNDCYHDYTVTTPNITCTTCSVSQTHTTPVCNNNNTGGNATDDYFSFSVTGTVTNGSGNYVVKIGSWTSPSLASGQAVSIVGNGLAGNPTLSANGSNITVRVEDAVTSTCFTTFTVSSAPCSTCPSPNCGTVTVQKN